MIEHYSFDISFGVMVGYDFWFGARFGIRWCKTYLKFWCWVGDGLNNQVSRELTILLKGDTHFTFSSIPRFSITVQERCPRAFVVFLEGYSERSTPRIKSQILGM